MPKIIEHKIENNIELKICSGKLCNKQVWKKLDEFSKSSKRWDGLESICKKCRSYVRSPEYTQMRKDIRTKELKNKELNKDKKQCTKCKIYLEYKDFSKDSRNKDKLSRRCRSCKSTLDVPKNIGKVARSEYTKKDDILGKTCSICNEWKSFKDNNFKQIGFYIDKKISYASECRECFNEKEQKRYHETKVLMTEEELHESKINKSIKQRNEYIIEIEGKKYKKCAYHNIYEPLSNFRKDGNKKYYTGESKYYYICIESHNKLKRIRRSIDEEYKILCNLRCRIYGVLNGLNKSDNTINLLGCSIEFLWNYLENKFQPGMTRENYGQVWHVDHIKPCSIFDLTYPREQRKCFNWKNLQPLFAQENLQKSCKYTFDIVHEVKLHFIK